LRSQLFKPNRPNYLDLAVDPGDVQQVILDSPEFQKFAEGTRDLTSEWFDAHRAALAAITADTRPNGLIASIGDDLLARFRPVPLLDEYDAYEQLMSYWHDTMHDDVFLIMNEGWEAAAKPRRAIEDKDRKLSETPDLVIGSGKSATKFKMDLLPPNLIVARYFADDKARVDELNTEAELATQAVEDYIEEHGGDEGLLSDAVNDKGKLTQAAAKDALKVASAADDKETVECARAALALLQAEAATKKDAKEAQAVLDEATVKKYGDLVEADVQALVLEDKWLDNVRGRIASEANSLTLSLVARIQLLGERYAETVEELEAELQSLDAKVARHLAEMGVS
jgi:type I restriction enzyme M protein